MNSRTITYAAWSALALTLIAWGALGYFALTIMHEEETQVFLVSQAEDASSKRAIMVRDHALIADTALSREHLSALVRADVLSVADMIDSAGKSAGVALHLGGASPKGSVDAGSTKLVAVSFVIDADAKFPALTKALALLGSLQVPSTIERLDLERVHTQDGAKDTGLWHLSAEIKVLTASDVTQ